MQFELTKELIDLIIYGMENQDKQLIFDSERLDVVSVDNSDDSDRFIALPIWQSVQGFALMERFVITVSHPIVREELRQILVQGRGVFRQFKNTLKEYREIERQWFYFKEHAMQTEVMNWYNDLRELWGLQGVQLEDYTFEELLLADFDVYRVENAKCHELLVNEQGPIDMYRSEGYYWGAGAPGGSIAGLCGGYLESDAFIVELFYTLPDYRGVGIARFIIDKLVSEIQELGASRVLFRLEGESLRLAKHLEKKGSLPVSETLALRL